MKRNLFCIFLLFFGWVSFNGYAQNKKDSMRVLFIGNSFTYANDLPKMVQKIAATQRVNIACTQVTQGGVYLAANVIFSTIYQQPYQTGETIGFLPEQAEYIQQVAQ